MRPVIWPREKKLWVPGRRALLTGLGALAAGGLLTRKQAKAVTITSSAAVPSVQDPSGNLLRRNGGFEVWQRGAGGSAGFSVPAGTTGGQYTADGWYVATAASEPASVGQIGGIASNSQFSAYVQRNPGATGVTPMRFGFPLDTDELWPMLGQFVCLSFTATAGANWSPAGGTLSVVLYVGTGTPSRFTSGGFTGISQAITLNAPLTAAATRFQATSAAVIPAGTRQAEFNFLWTPVGTAGASDLFIVDECQIEVVSSPFAQATPFQRRLFGEELLLCQRHFWKSFPYATAPAQNATGVGALRGIVGKAGAVAAAGILPVRCPVPMRVGPTVTSYNPSAANAEIRDSTGVFDFTGTTVANISVNDLAIVGTGNAGGAVGNQIIVHAQADAGI